MVRQDVRIVELIKWETPMGISREALDAKDYLTITYYDQIRVRQVTVGTNESPMEAAYRAMGQDQSDGKPAGEPDSASASEPDSGSAGGPDSGSAGEPDSASAGEPDSGSAGESDSGSAGESDSGSAGEPDSGSAGEPDSGSAGEPDSGSAGASGSGAHDYDDYEFRQRIVGFADVTEEKEKALKAFWETRDEPLFFVTMVNVSLTVDLKDELARIRAVMDGSKLKYWLYLTYEYDEILLFVKSPNFREYAECVMRIGFQQENSGVLDTITVCCFGDSSQSKSYQEQDVQVCIQLGVKNYQKAVAYLVDKGVKLEEIYWVLGRTDIGFLKVNSGLSWVHELYEECRNPKQAEAFDWLVTTQFSVMVRPEEMEKRSEELSGSPVKTRWHAVTKEKLASLYPQYEKKCKKLHIRPDPVFKRMLYETGRLVDNALENRLSQDLAVCILPELEDFQEYLGRILRSPLLQERYAEKLRSILNTFYLNVLSLVNSTVHSNQEFVLIPHAAPPSFEMPPKVIAYYGVVVRQIIDTLRDDDRIYSVMLAPKLVDELEVDSLSRVEFEEVGHLLSVGIGEQFLYNPRDTLITLGHEMAHFVGEEMRARDCRRKKIFTYYIYTLMTELNHQCLRRLPGQAEAELGGKLDTEQLRIKAGELSDIVVKHNPSKRPLLHELRKELEKLAGMVLHDPECEEKVYNNVILPLFQGLEHRKYLRQPLDAVLKATKVAGKDSATNEAIGAYLDARTKWLFRQAVKECLRDWPAFCNRQKFLEYVGYLFSESYADLTMILLFNMTIEEYIHVFSQSMGELKYHSYEAEDVPVIDESAEKPKRSHMAEDAIEMTRFIVVVRAMVLAKKGSWGKEAAGGEAASEQSPNWADKLRGIAGTIYHDWKHGLTRFCKKNHIDIVLVTCLVQYLTESAGLLEKHFKKKSTAVELLHKLYQETKESTVLSHIDMIREQERLCLDQLTLSPEEQKRLCLDRLALSPEEPESEGASEQPLTEEATVS